MSATPESNVLEATASTTIANQDKPKNSTGTTLLTSIRKIGVIGWGGPGIEKILMLARRVKPSKYALSLMGGHTDVSHARRNFPSGENAPEWLKKWRAAEKQDADDPERFSILELGETGDGARGDPKIGKAATRAKRKVLEDFVDAMDLTIIMASLGGGTGSGGSPEIAQVIKQAKKPGIAIVAMPFKSEGPPRGAIATESLEKLLSSIRTFPFYSEGRPTPEGEGKQYSNDFARPGKKDVDPRSLFADMNEYSVTQVLLTIDKLNQRTGAVMIADFSDNTKLCLQPGEWFCSSCDLPVQKSPASNTDDQPLYNQEGEINIQEVARKLLWGNPYHNFNLSEMTNCILLFQNPKWRGSKIDALTEEILNAVVDEQVRQKVDIKIGYKPQGNPGVTFIAVGGGPIFERMQAEAGKAVGEGKSAAAKAADGAGAPAPPPAQPEPTQLIYVNCTPDGSSYEVPVPASIATIWNAEKDARRKRTSTMTDAEVAELLNPYIAKRYPGKKFFGATANHDHPLLVSQTVNGSGASQSVKA